MLGDICGYEMFKNEISERLRTFGKRCLTFRANVGAQNTGEIQNFGAPQIMDTTFFKILKLLVAVLPTFHKKPHFKI
jgi:hypothetical protein